MKKIYLAAQFARREELRAYAALLRGAGFETTSTWLDTTNLINGKMSNNSDDDNARRAVQDIVDVERADGVLFFSEDPLVGIPRGARHVEFGYALAQGKELAIIGGRENVFHWMLPDWAFYGSVEEFIAAGACGYVYKPDYAPARPS